MTSDQMWQAYKILNQSIGDNENLFSNWLHEVGLHFSQDSLVVLEEFRVVYPID